MSRFASAFFCVTIGFASASAIPVAAAEITFFEDAGFGGRSITLRGFTPNFAEIGFNDRASSVVVRSGTWQVCTDANFMGTCVTLARGDYQALDSRLDGKISSARELGSQGGNPGGNYGGQSNNRRGSIRLFSDADFRGESVLLDRDTGNLANINFNDRAASAIVENSSWEICSDAFFRGECSLLQPGRYRRLEGGNFRSVSSARQAREEPTRPSRPDRGGAGIELYEHADFVGRRFESQVDVPNLAARDFNDITSSIIVHRGNWQFCTDAFFQGRCTVFGPGRHNNMSGMNDQFSSFRRVN